MYDFSFCAGLKDIIDFLRYNYTTTFWGMKERFILKDKCSNDTVVFVCFIIIIILERTVELMNYCRYKYKT